MGKMLLFSIIAFFLLAKDKLKIISVPEYDKRNALFAAAGILLAPLFFPAANMLLFEPNFLSNLPLSLLSHAFIIFIPLLLALGFLGLGFFKKFISVFRKELIICALLNVIGYFAIFYIWGFWPYLSDAVLRVVYFLFSLSLKNVYIIEPRTLFVERFAVTIEQACSGLESFLLFTGLYILLGIMDWKKISHMKYAVLYILGSLLLFFVNTLRVYLIIWSGLIFSPELAGKLFHTYLGMVLFLGYFILLLKISYAWLKK